MRRTTIAIPDELALALESESKRTGDSVSAIARRALKEHLGIGADGRRKLGFVGVGRSGDGESDVASRMEDLMGEYGFGEPYSG